MGTEMQATANKQARQSITNHDGASLWMTTRRAYGHDVVVYVKTKHARPTRREINRALQSAKRMEAGNVSRRAA